MGKKEVKKQKNFDYRQDLEIVKLDEGGEMKSSVGKTIWYK